MAIALTFKMNVIMPALERKRALCTDRKSMNEVSGLAAKDKIMRHLITRDTTHPNRLGGDRTHFWRQMSASTTMQADDNGATVSINQVGARLQLFGGTVKPVNGGKFLTIPAIPEAHGRRALEFDNLKVLFGKKGPYALGESGERAKVSGKTVVTQKEKAWRKSERGAGRNPGKINVPSARVVFWLVRSATIQPHPDVLPPEKEILSHCYDRLIKYLQRQKGRLEGTA